MAVIGERGSGKTSLIKRVLEDDLNMSYLHVDFAGIRDIREVTSRLLNSITAATRCGLDLNEVVERLGVLRPTIGIDRTGETKLVFHVGSDDIEEYTQHALMFISHLMDNNFSVFFDNFDAFFSLPDHGQLWEQMKDLLIADAKSPVIISCLSNDQLNFKNILKIREFSEDILYAFISTKLHINNSFISKDVFSLIYRTFYGNVSSILHFFRTSFFVSSENTEYTAVFVKEVMNEIASSQREYFDEVINGRALTMFQRNLLIHLASDSHSPYSNEFMVKLKTTSASGITKGLDALFKKHLVFRHENEYRFFNPILREWILNNDLLAWIS